MDSKSRIIAGSFGVILIAIVGGVGVYLPNFSQAAKNGEEARRQLRAQGVEHAPGGMWKNINERAKQVQEKE